MILLNKIKAFNELCIRESFNTNISHQLSDYTISALKGLKNTLLFFLFLLKIRIFGSAIPLHKYTILTNSIIIVEYSLFKNQRKKK
jgi:hypothetical protein